MRASNMLLAALVAPATAWVTKSQSVYGAQISEIQAMMRGQVVSRDTRAQLGYLWTYPESVTDDTGLGGGITYAFNPKLCSKLNKVNSEDTWLWSLVDCNSFKAAIDSAFNKWAANSRHLKFIDVSKECDALKQNFGPPTDKRQSGPFPHGGCQLAEIWITSMAPPAPPTTAGRMLEEQDKGSLGNNVGDDASIPTAFGFYTHEGGEHGLDLAHHITADGLPMGLPMGDGRRRQLQEDVGSTGSNLGGVATAVATALSHARYSSANPKGFRYTSGKKPFHATALPSAKPSGGYSSTWTPGSTDFPPPDKERIVVETYAGTFSFNVDGDICWYLDSQFCYGIHVLKGKIGNAATAKLTIDGITFGLMGLGIAFYAILVIRLACKMTGLGNEDEDGDGVNDADEDGDGKVTCCERMNYVLHEIADWNPLMMAFFICIIICPVMFSAFIFDPCFKCYDFEAAATHEIGHFLGLGHPDNIPNNWSPQPYAKPKAGENVYSGAMVQWLKTNTRPIPNKDCFGMWESVKAGVPANSTTTGALLASTKSSTYPYRPAQMQAFTQHNPNTCLTDDDLEALSTLYPDCAAGAQLNNVCHLTSRNIGVVRIMIYLLSPAIFGLLAVMTVSSFFHAWERHRNELMRKERAQLKLTNTQLNADLDSAQDTAQKAVKVAKAQKERADETSRKARKSNIAAKFQIAAAKSTNTRPAAISATEVEIDVASASEV